MTDLHPLADAMAVGNKAAIGIDGSSTGFNRTQLRYLAIRNLNDRFRESLHGGRVYLTPDC